MTNASISELLTTFFEKAVRSSLLVAFLVVATVMASVPARAQSNDTWKSIAIIGGSTAAGALIGHKVGGTTGAYVGAAAGAATGYAIDRRRRQNEYYNNDYYGDNGGYYGNNSSYSRNGGYYNDSRGGYPSDYQGNNDCDNRQSRRRR
jgi:hypothetical protein